MPDAIGAADEPAGGDSAQACNASHREGRARAEPAAEPEAEETIRGRQALQREDQGRGHEAGLRRRPPAPRACPDERPAGPAAVSASGPRGTLSISPQSTPTPARQPG
jgi:hypothetical protein